MSLVIDLIGQLNSHVLAVRLVKVDWCFSIRLLLVKIVSSVYCLSVLVSLISRL